MGVEVTLVEHPLVADSLARIRDRDTPNPPSSSGSLALARPSSDAHERTAR